MGQAEPNKHGLRTMLALPFKISDPNKKFGLRCMTGIKITTAGTGGAELERKQNSKVGRVNLASFKWKDSKDNKNCSALELGKSSLTVMHIQGKCSPYRLPNSTWWRAISESIKGDNQRYRAMMKGGWSVGKSTVIPQEDTDLPLASGQAINTGNYITKLGFGTPAQISYTVLDTDSIIAWITYNPCSSCSSGLQLFETSKSSTYKYFTYASQECQSVGLCKNTSNDVNCSFGQIYGDQSEVDGLSASGGFCIRMCERGERTHPALIGARFGWVWEGCSLLRFSKGHVI
ncbi:hypothetical protein SUGI_0229560 [Cryptomeria japonica]|nr:hypothetical protein SUGI_0229560 [Cryptomeria japonica]